jgi:glucose/arabinose dehydrogenase
MRIFASGLRNPNGMDWAPGTSTLWTVVNERDMLGDDVPPNYLTSVRDGAFYGWGRPVGVTVGPDGSLLVADDAGGTCRG